MNEKMKNRLAQQAWNMRMTADNLTSGINHRFVDRLQEKLKEMYPGEKYQIHNFAVKRADDGKVTLDCGSKYSSNQDYEWVLNHDSNLYIDGSLDLVWEETFRVCIAKYTIRHYAKIPEEDLNTLRAIGKIKTQFQKAQTYESLSCGF